VTVDPTSLVALNCLAMAYEADPDPHLRDGAKALRLAQVCVQETQRREPVYLMTLADAYAELRQFGKACETAQEALSLTPQGASSTLVKDLQGHLEMYRRGQAVHERYLIQSKR
jgi:hypothetical protein